MAARGNVEFRDCLSESDSEEKERDSMTKDEDRMTRDERWQSGPPLRKADLEKVDGEVDFLDCHHSGAGSDEEEDREEEVRTLVRSGGKFDGRSIGMETSPSGKRQEGTDEAGGALERRSTASGTRKEQGSSMAEEEDEKEEEEGDETSSQDVGAFPTAGAALGDTKGNTGKEREEEKREGSISRQGEELHTSSQSPTALGGSDAVQNDVELLLLASRHGDATGIYALIRKYEDRGDCCNFIINCKGQQKSNRGWTPLHLACYFGHDKAILVLLTHGANINAVNPNGDTPLHKGAYIGREDIVQILIEHGADVFALNGEGMSPKDLAYGAEVKRLIEGAEQSQLVQSQQTLLHAASSGDLEAITKLLKGPRPPDINCTDPSGNTPLHRASCSDQREAAILLLQSGAKTELKNARGQTTLDLAQSHHIRQLLSLRTMKVVQSYVNKFEGPLYRASLVRRKHLWVVLDQGIMTYYRNRADAYARVKRQGYKSLEQADIKINRDEANMFAVKYKEGTTHLWMLDEKFSADLTRQSWISALKEHRSYSDRLANCQVIADSDSDGEDDEGESGQPRKLLPISSIQDGVKNAQTRHHLLEESIQSLSQWLDGTKENSTNSINQSELRQRLQGILDRSHEACSALSSCMAVMSGQEELRTLQLRQDQERIRNLQDALHALAKQHDRLELFTSTLSTSPNNHFHDVAGDFDLDNDREFYSVRDSGSPAGSLDEQLSDVESFYSVRMDGGQRSPVEDATSRVSDSENHSNSKQSEGDVVIAKNGRHNGIENRDTGKQDVFTFSNVPNIIIPGCTRMRLPATMYRRDHMTLWTVLKQCIGKELSKITMPVVFNEPLSFLQRCCEYIEHAHLLVKASMSDDPVDRMKFVTAFVVSASASNVDRFGKPFNPLLGETYELSRDDIDTRMLLEQVSHHPPVSAFHATSPHFEFHGAVHPKLKFWGKSMEVQPKGVVTIRLPKHGESYTFHNVLMCVHNLIVGRLWIEQYGTLEIINHKTGHRSTLNFKPAGWFGRDLHKIEGHITDKRGKKLCYLYGNWTEYLCAVETDVSESRKEERKEEKRRKAKGLSEKSPPNSPGADSGPAVEGAGSDAQILWQNLPRPEDSMQYYSFTSFAMKLNELGEGMESSLPCTDSRLRPDIRHLENGDIDGASDEKHRLEENQRARRKQRNKSKETWVPLWFKADVNSLTGEQDWVFKGKYWDRNYSVCPTIF